MKKLFTLFAFILVLSACEPKDDGSIQYTDIVGIEDVEVPTTATQGEDLSIKVFYKKKTTCHEFDTFIINSVTNTMLVILQNKVTVKSDCETITDSEELEEASFSFKPTSAPGTFYTIKFFKGKGENNQDLFIEKSILVE